MQFAIPDAIIFFCGRLMLINAMKIAFANKFHEKHHDSFFNVGRFIKVSQLANKHWCARSIESSFQC